MIAGIDENNYLELSDHEVRQLLTEDSNQSDSQNSDDWTFFTQKQGRMIEETTDQSTIH
jgi:hypothetical protein